MTSFIKKITYVALSCIMLVVAAGITCETAEGATKAKTSQSAKKKSTSSKKKKSTSKKKKKTTTNKKSSSKKKKTTGTSKKKSSSKSKKSKKSRSRKSSRRTTKIQHKQYTPPAEEILNDSLTLTINDALVMEIPDNINPGGLRVNSVKPDAQRQLIKIGLNENFTYLPVTNELIRKLRKAAIEAMPDSLKSYDISLMVRDKSLSYYITQVDKLPEQFRKNVAFVVDCDPFIHPTKGMEGDIIAIWPSHGRYYKPSADAWMWQRPYLYQVTEDTYTMGYVLPFIVPMLENAGAYVMLPRERDINKNEVIVDNDTNDAGQIFSQPYYKEQNGTQRWTTGEEEGFIYDLPDFRDTENPFENGTYRQVQTVGKGGAPSIAAWYADIPENGEYAVYISYKTLPNSSKDALYTVNYSGGSKQFKVNQTMGGGTWIYLGTFPLEAGYSDTEPVVTLSNVSGTPGQIITADAVKIGGGMGNISRSPNRSDIYIDPSTPEETLAAEDDEEDDSENDDSVSDSENGETDENVDEEPATSKSSTLKASSRSPHFSTSGMPRYLEGARYWLQWAGIPDDVYSPYEGGDDYKDDYTSRGHWVNYLAGGSRVLPGRDGLNIPVDLAMALHTDAGTKGDNSSVGTLGIYYTNGGDSYIDGTPRINSRMLTDMLMRQITGDIRQQWEPDWTRRSMWDKSYVEARVPEVPTSLIELLSHQNFGDMIYGLDPEFRFTVSRSIYKALARFVAERKDREVVIQPLPVKNFAITRHSRNNYRLSWEPQKDKLEPTADPQKYIIMERNQGELGFHKIAETERTHIDIKCSDADIHSFKVIAANAGGLSFPSEILAFREAPGEKEPVMIINGFTRISAPASFETNGMRGFETERDFGVPYINDISFTGYQTDYTTGKSSSDYASSVIAGNTFDFPVVHGEAISNAGRGFVSSSLGAVESGTVKLSDYKTVDLILGKQKSTVKGRGNNGVQYTAFPSSLQNDITKYLDKGGKLFVSGQYVASDLFDPRAPQGSVEFAEKTLGLSIPDSERNYSGRIEYTSSDFLKAGQSRTLNYSTTLNDRNYVVEFADVLNPSNSRDYEVVLSFPDSGKAAGIVSKKGKSRTAITSIPFESIESAADRNTLMRDVLDWLDR